VTQFAPAVAGEARQKAIIACVLAWLAIIVYLWIRFGQARWGVAAVVCLIHDVIISVGLVALSEYLARTAVGQALLITPVQVDMTIIAAFLTIIGYSVNDTIVVFDRIRENRGKLKVVDAHTINHAINQTLSRTLLTSATVVLALFVMYAIGGAGIHPFCYAMLPGVLVGTYSSIAVAAPLLLGFKEAAIGKAHLDYEAAAPAPAPAPTGPPAVNPSQPGNGK
jgi:SecD/SecF fusion protein